MKRPPPIALTLPILVIALSGCMDLLSSDDEPESNERYCRFIQPHQDPSAPYRWIVNSNGWNPPLQESLIFREKTVETNLRGQTEHVFRDGIALKWSSLRDTRLTRRARGASTTGSIYIQELIEIGNMGGIVSFGNEATLLTEIESAHSFHGFIGEEIEDPVEPNEAFPGCRIIPELRITAGSGIVRSLTIDQVADETTGAGEDGDSSPAYRIQLASNYHNFPICRDHGNRPERMTLCRAFRGQEMIRPGIWQSRSGLRRYYLTTDTGPEQAIMILDIAIGERTATFPSRRRSLAQLTSWVAERPMKRLMREEYTIERFNQGTESGDFELVWEAVTVENAPSLRLSHASQVMDVDSAPSDLATAPRISGESLHSNQGRLSWESVSSIYDEQARQLEEYQRAMDSLCSQDASQFACREAPQPSAPVNGSHQR